MAASVTAKVRMYRLGELGDCFLVTFVAGAKQSRMLIDCGSFRNSGTSIARLKQVADDIKQDLSGQALDVVVGTHQHNDHLSGFVHCESQFKAMKVEQVWMSWLDNPRDSMAKGIAGNHNKLKVALHAASQKLRAGAPGEKGMRSLEVLDDMLGFYGVIGAKKKLPPVLPANAVEILRKLGKNEPDYLKPGQVLDMPGLPAGSVRVYVLGPPRDDKLLHRVDPRTGESYDHALAAANFSAARLLSAATNGSAMQAAEEQQYPFTDSYKCRAHGKRSRNMRDIQRRYDAPEEEWRRIDDDWMQQAESLALYLDTFTNNTSLVIAIELVESGKVMLFAADAQVGNWVSWADVKWEKPGVTTDDLLARTVLYKVGHHASHNATLVAALEKMTHPDLSALIPVDKKDSNITKKNGWKMPARNLFRRLIEKASSRVIQMDGVQAKSCDLTSKSVIASWKKAGITPRETPMFMEVEIRG